jgi:hypothetical protein
MPERSNFYSGIKEHYAKQKAQIETLNLIEKNGKIFLGK